MLLNQNLDIENTILAQTLDVPRKFIKSLLNRIKFFTLFIIVFGMNCNMTFAADDLSYLTIEEKNWLKAHPTLRLGIDTSFPPFDFIESNKHSGIFADYVQLLSKQLGISITYENNLTWGQVLLNAKQKKLDIISAIQKTPERSQYLLFTNPITTVPWVIISRTREPIHKDLSQLKNQTVAMVKNYAVVELAKNKFPNLQIKLVDSTLDGLRAVATGRVNLLVENLGVAGLLIQKHALTNLTISNEAGLGMQELSFAVRSDFPELLSILNKAIKESDKDELRKINQRWLSLLTIPNQNNKQQDNDWVLILVFILGIFIIFLASSYYYNSLRSVQLLLKFGSQTYKFYVFSFVFVFITLIILATWYGIGISKHKALDAIRNSLEIVRDSTGNVLNIWLENKESIINQISSENELITMVEKLIKIPANKKSIIATDVTNEIRAFFRKKKTLLGELDFLIINKDNISISAIMNTNIGSISPISQQKPELLKRVFNGETVFIPPIYSDVQFTKTNNNNINNTSSTTLSEPPKIFIASPIRNSTGEVIAAFTYRLIPKKQFSQILSTGRFGDTAETYTFDDKGLLLSESRFINELVTTGLLPENRNSALSIKISDSGGSLLKGFSPDASKDLPLTTMAISAIKSNKETNIKGYRNYNGVEVYGAWRWLAELDIGIVAEIGVESALHSYYTSRNIIFAIVAILLIITLTTLVFTITMANRTNRLLKRSHNDLEAKVSERTKEINSKDKLFKYLLDSSPIGVMMTTSDALVQYANTAAAKILRYKHRQLLTKKINEFYYDPNLRNFLLNEIKTKGFVSDRKFKSRRGDGTKGWARISLLPIEFQQKPVILSWFYDITSQMAHEKDLAEAKERAEKANRAKSEFLSSMSHELRTPLNAIIGFGQLLTIKAKDDETKNKLGEITNAGRYLLSLVNDMLDLTAIETGNLSLSFDDINLNDIITECLSLIAPLADKRNIHITLPSSQQCISCYVSADYIRLKQTFLNFLSNAIKYNREGGCITVSSNISPNNKIRITITDTGIGMTDSQLQNLFQKFNRVGAELSDIEGTGIGLVITKHIIELMGGSIGVESQLGIGSSFWVELNTSKKSDLDL